MTEPLKEDFIRAYVGRTLEIDCTRVVLRGGKADSPQVFEGPGAITQDQSGEFQLKMFARDVTQLVGFRMLSTNAAVKPGVLLPPEAFYSLEATDWEGRTWTCHRVRPLVSSGPGGAIIRAEVGPLLSASSGEGSSKHWLRLVFPEVLKLAWNRSTHEVLKSGDRTLRERVERTRAEFTVDDLCFEVRNDERERASTTVVVRSPNPLPLGIEWRVREALRFIVFRGVSWGIAEIAATNEHRIQIVPPQSSRRSLLEPPLHTTDAHDDYWHLFGAYLKHVCKHDDPSSFHPLSGRLNALFDLRSPHIETLALLLGVVVEGVLRTEFGDLGVPDDDFLAELDMAPRLIEEMVCGPQLKKRLCGTLPAMRSASVKDKLHGLKKRGLVSESSIEAWSRLRHKAAHAAQLDPFQLQEHVDRCYKVYELLLTLIYISIGYEGTYRQYSAQEWPLAKFPPELNGPATTER